VRLEDRRVVAVTGYLHGLSHGNLLAIPVFLTAWSEFTTDLAVLGLLAAVAYACFGLSSLPFGYLADRRPERGMLLLCVAGIAGSLAAVASSPSLPLLAGSLAALGLFSGIYHPTGLSLISRRVKEPGRGFGWHGMGGSLGVALGPAAVGSLLAAGWPWRSVAAILILPTLLGFAWLFTSRVGRASSSPDAHMPPPSPRSLLTATMALILLVYALAGIAYWGSLTFLPLALGTQAYVALLALGAVGQVLSGQLAEATRSERMLLVLSAAAGALLIFFGSATANAPAVLAWAYGLLLFSLEPLQNVLVAREVPWAGRGMAYGMTFFAVFGVGSLGSALGGYLLRRGAYGLLFAGLGALLIASGVCGLLAGKRTGRAPPS